MMMRENKPDDAARRKMLDGLRAIDFAIQETVLYLDAYPDHREALEYYHRLIDARREAMEKYEADCGPLTIYGNTDRAAWEWTSDLWPWHPDAN